MRRARASSRRRPARPSQAGATLVEVMVCLVLVSVFMIGMNMFWVATIHQFDDLALRQKAVFRLNSEMERLAGLLNDGTVVFNCGQVTNYTTAPDDAASYLGTSVTSVGSGTGLGCSLGATTYNDTRRFIYTSQTLTTLTPWITTDASFFGTPPAADDTNLESVYRQVLVWDAGTGGDTTDDRNLVWLDAERDVVAQISWDLQYLHSRSDMTAYPPCAGATTCKLLTLYLDYPFRYASSTNPRENTMGPVETITLQTIVGRNL